MRGTESLKHSNNIEPFEELVVIRIELVKDFIVEPMFATEFSCSLPNVRLGVHS